MIEKKNFTELKKRMTKNDCSVNRIIGYYVTEDEKGNKSISSQFSKHFQNLEDNEFYKYLEIIKQILSGKVGDNLIKTDITDKEVKTSLYSLSSSQLKQEGVLEALRDSIIRSYKHTGNYLMLFFSDTYDIPDKSTDGLRTGESSEIYQYIICAICPVELSKPGLGCISEAKEIGVLEGDWTVSKVESGFIYPSFEDRSSNSEAAVVYNKNPKDVHKELTEDILKCEIGLTSSERKKIFTDALSDVLSESESKMVYTGVQAAIYEKVEDNVDFELSKENISQILKDGFIEEENVDQVSEKICESLKDENDNDCLAFTVLDTNVAKKAEKELESELDLINIKVSSPIAGMVKLTEENGCMYVRIPIKNNEIVRVNGKLIQEGR